MPTSSDPLEGLDLSGLATPGGDAPGAPLSLPPVTINWRELSDTNAIEVWKELASWVQWACERYDITDKVVPVCWWQHSYLVEELSALFAAWMAFYDVADTGTGPIGWLEKLAASKMRMRDNYSQACTRVHTDPAGRVWPDQGSEWAEWISTTHAHRHGP